MEYDYDYVIVGSGFGGSVSALRLAEKGYKVLVIEKGKWYNPDDFAKSNWDLKRWLWMPMFRFFGIMKISIFKHMNILSGHGVGGGSLVYANTLPVPKREFFEQGSWAGLANWEAELNPHYDTALNMLGATANPKLYDGDMALKELAKQIGREEHFETTHVGVFFGDADKSSPDPYFKGKGPQRTGCNFCGGCMTGCRHNAKNSLDKNYLYLAQGLGVEIIAEHEVVDVLPVDANNKEGYWVKYKKSTSPFAKTRKCSSKGVIFSGGVLGTVNLLLKLKKHSLPNLSNYLGHDIRTNNETLISVTNLDKTVEMSKGVAIGSIIHTDENSHLEMVRYNEDSGFWRLLHWPLTVGKNTPIRLAKLVKVIVGKPITYLRWLFTKNWGKHTAVLLFMQTLDSTLQFKLNSTGLVSRLSKGPRPTPNIPISLELTKKYSEIVKGVPSVFFLETAAGLASTAHILGGAVMGSDASNGVINRDNEVFGYQNMYVVDGSMISANPGVNPSLSITAIAELAMSKIEKKE